MGTDNQQKQLKIKTEYITSYHLKPGSDRVFIFLHGFKQDGMAFYQAIKTYIPEAAAHHIPNGPYPVPIRVNKQYQMAYSWYFFDAPNSQFVRDMSLALQTVRDQLESEDILDYKKVIIGFSQGGYLAPYMAQSLNNVEKVIGIHSRYRHEDFKKPFEFPIYSIHGMDDEIVSPKGAEHSFNKLLEIGNQGEFLKLDGTGHVIDSKVGESVKRVLDQ